VRDESGSIGQLSTDVDHRHKKRCVERGRTVVKLPDLEDQQGTRMQIGRQREEVPCCGNIDLLIGEVAGE